MCDLDLLLGVIMCKINVKIPHFRLVTTFSWHIYIFIADTSNLVTINRYQEVSLKFEDG